MPDSPRPRQSPPDAEAEPDRGSTAAARSKLSGRLGLYGRGTLIALAVILIAGFGLRMEKVVNPLTDPGDDAFAYRALAESLYEEGSYGGPGFDTPSDWSPGAPLLYAGAYYLTGGVRDGVGRGVEAVLGTAAILVVFLLTIRILRPRAGPGRAGPGTDPFPAVEPAPAPPSPSARTAALIAAGMVAFYPPFIYSTGALLSEPPALFTLPAAVLAFLWADSRSTPWAWVLPGLLFGATALIRPEYLAVAFAFGILLLVRWALARGWRRTVPAAIVFAAAIFLPIIPWSIHNYVSLDRVVPITTGGGKALFVGTNLPNDGDYQRVKASLLEEYTGRVLEPGSDQLDRVRPVPLFDRAARQYPDLNRDAALGRIGKDNLSEYLGSDPLGYLGMTVRKTGRMWGSTVGEAMSDGVGAAIQKLLVLLGLAGLILLAWRRRWEAIALAIPLVVVTVVGAATLAPPRRNEILMTLVLPLAAVALTELGALLTGRPGTDATDQEEFPIRQPETT